MKYLKKFLVLILPMFILIGCADLDLQPTAMIAEDAVKKDPKLVEAFLTKIYANANFEPNEGVGYPNQDRLTDAVVGGEYTLMAPWQNGIKASTHVPTASGAHSRLAKWQYGNIRSTNEIIEILNEASFDPQKVKEQIAEAKFLRAWMYFEMVKRYGGVPLELEAKSVEAPVEELMIPRSSLKDCYDQIIADLDAGIADLPPTATLGKATSMAARALKSRAALYAARIAKYHPQSANGLTSIPASSAQAYYQMAHGAASAVIESGRHPLYKGGANLVDNFSELFYKNVAEHIFVEEYNLALGKTHTWSGYAMPDGFKAGWGSNMHMYLSSDARFEHVDGSPGDKHHSKFNNNTWFDIEEVIYTKDPRYLATVFTPEDIFQGREVWFHNASVGNAATGVKGRAGNVVPTRAPTRNRNRGGRLIQKRIDPAIEFPPFGTDETPYIVLRTGEMYLNGAEAAFELNLPNRAKELINTLRARAGMPAKTQLTLDLIKNERFVELYAENHRYWDLRTWRDAEAELHFKLKQGSKWTRRASDGKYKANKWRWNFSQNTPFLPKMYWLPFGTGRISQNPNLVENPGY